MTAAADVTERAPPGRRRILHSTSLGALANTGASAVRLIFQLALLPILARLIGPAEYGLVALAMPVILFANVIADGGLVAGLGRLRTASKTLESTAFWITVAVGACLAAAACAAAFPISWALHQPRLPLLILALSPILLMNSATAVFNGRIIRERRFVTFALGDLFSTLSGAVVALFAATHGWGAWSLVAQQLAFWVCKLTWITSRGGAAIGFLFRFDEVRDLAKFGANNIGAMIAEFLSKNIDNMIVGGVLGATSLGYYAMAYQLIRIPDMLISGPFWFYIFTAMSRLAHLDDRDGIANLARAGLRLGAAALAPLFCGLALVADLLVGTVLGAKWTGAIAPLQLLAGAGFGFCLCSIMAAMLMGLGKSALQLRLGSGLALVTIVTVAGAAPFGLTPVAAALASGVGAVALLYVLILAAQLHVSRVRLLQAFFPAAAGCAALTLAVLAARWALAGGTAVLELVAAMAAGGAAYAVTIVALARRQLLADARAFSQAHADAHEPTSDAEAAHAQEEAALNPIG